MDISRLVLGPPRACPKKEPILNESEKCENLMASSEILKIPYLLMGCRKVTGHFKENNIHGRKEDNHERRKGFVLQISMPR